MKNNNTKKMREKKKKNKKNISRNLSLKTYVHLHPEPNFKTLRARTEVEEV